MPAGDTPGERGEAMVEALPHLMLVTDRRRIGSRDLVRTVAEAVAGGAGIVQIREKDLPDEALLELVIRLKRSVPAGTLLVVNGSLEVARAAGVGLHLAAGIPFAGTASAPVPGARRMRPQLYGRSAHSQEEAREAARENPSYLVLGPIYPTPSKPWHPGSGADLVREACQIAGRIPVFAIGGMTPARVEAVVAAGAYGVAVSGALLSAPEPRSAAQEFLRAFAATAG